MKYRLILTLGVLVLFVGAMPSHAQWSTDPTVNNAICTATNFQEAPVIVSDGAGGAIITWQDRRSGSYYNSDIYAQRINASGVVQWAADGVAICTATNSQYAPQIVSDGAGGAIITWYDWRNGNSDIYAQRINASGVVQWAADGVAICTATNSQSYPTIVSDGAGGAIITWQDYRFSWYHFHDIYAQRINAVGVVQWAVDGVAICTETYPQNYPTIISDGTGGAIITWYDLRNNSNHIYAQRINSSGVAQWMADGVAVCTAVGTRNDFTVVSDGAGGAIITLPAYRSGSYHIYAQQINASGAMQWTADGVAICTATNYQSYPTMVSDGAGGAIITWWDSRSGGYGYDIYAQRINTLGVVQWTSDGVAVCTATNSQNNPTISSDGAGGAIITWSDGRSGNYSDIYAQSINASGIVQWTSDGIAICTATSSQSFPTIASDDAGGAIITWQDSRSGGYGYDIYAQRIRSDGTLGGNSAPLANAGADQTVIVNETVQLDGSGSSDLDGDPITYSWEITSKPAGSNATLSNPSIVNPTFVADMAGEYKVSLVVNDGLVNSTPDEVVITVITAQQASQDLIDQIQELIDAGILNGGQGNALISKLEAVIKQLNKGNTTAAINELQAFINEVHAYIKAGTLTPEEGQPLIDAANAIIATLNNPQIAKAGFQVDASESFTAVDQNKGSLPTGFQLEQNSPNPFNPVTTIQFAVPRESYVRLKVYNSIGAEVATLVDQRVAAGTYKVTWDASHLATGFYFSRLEAEGFAQTKKLLLMK